MKDSIINNTKQNISRNKKKKTCFAILDHFELSQFKIKPILVVKKKGFNIANKNLIH